MVKFVFFGWGPGGVRLLVPLAFSALFQEITRAATNGAAPYEGRPSKPGHRPPGVTKVRGIGLPGGLPPHRPPGGLPIAFPGGLSPPRPPGGAGTSRAGNGNNGRRLRRRPGGCCSHSRPGSSRLPRGAWGARVPQGRQLASPPGGLGKAKPLNFDSRGPVARF